MKFTMERLAALPMALALAGCGGGGGTGTPASPSAPTTPAVFSIGGSASGVEGSGLTLQLNGSSDTTVAADGPFTSGSLSSGTAYSVTVKTQPSVPRQTCTVANGSGTVGSGAITNVAVSCRTLVGKFLYVPNAVSNDINGYAINPDTGALTSLGAPFPTQNTPMSLSLHPTERFIYSVNAGRPLPPAPPTGPSIGGYAVNGATGALVEISGSPFTAAQLGIPGSAVTSGLSMDPQGKFAYLTALLAPALSLHGVAIDQATGGLSPLPGSPYYSTPGVSQAAVAGTFDLAGHHFYVPISAGALGAFDFDAATGALVPNSVWVVSSGGINPLDIARHPSGLFIYVSNALSGDIGAFSLDRNTGIATVVAGSPFATGGSFPLVVLLHPSGNFAYVVNSNTLGAVTPATVAAFTVNATTGVLTAIPGSPFATQGTNTAQDGSIGVLDPRGRFLYVNNTASNSISVFSIDQITGVLTPVVGSPFPTRARPSPVVDPSGKYLYASSRGENSVSSYSIHPGTGALTLTNTVPAGSLPTQVRVIGLQ